MIIGRAHGVARLGPARSSRLLLSWILLGLTRAAVLCLPFRVVRAFLRAAGPGAGQVQPDPPSQVETSLHDKARTIGLLTALAARHTPWLSECYPQALTARVQLIAARIPHTVLFGLRRTAEGSLVAHAWVTVAGVTVVGGDPSDFTVVGSFPWLPVPR